MKREEIAESIRESIIDYDKELIIDAAVKLRSSVDRFYYEEINLRGNYPELLFKYSGSIGFTFTFKENSLVGHTDLEKTKIILKKVSVPTHVLQNIEERILDELFAKDNKIICKFGELKIDEVDDYLAEIFCEIVK